MTSFEIYNLLGSLSKEDRRNLTRSLSPSNGQSSRIGLLYNRIRGVKVWSKKSESQIRGKEFRSADKYYQSRIRLTNKIVKCLIQYESSSYSPVEFIEKAFELDIAGHAVKVLHEEQKKAYQREDYSYLLHLRELYLRFRNSAHSGQNSEDIEQFLCSSELVDLHHSHQVLSEVVERIRLGMKKPSKERVMLAGTLEKRIDGFQKETPKLKYLFLKGLSGIFYLRGEMEQALDVQLSLVKHLQLNRERFIPETLKEYSILIRMQLGFRDSGGAANSLFEISMLPIETRRDKRLKRWHSINNSIVVGERFGRLEFARKALSEMRSFRSEFTNERYSTLLYYCALVFWYNRDFSTGIDCINEILGEDSGSRKRIQWCVDLLQILLHFDKGNLDTVDYLIRRFRRSIHKFEIEYPGLVVSTIESILEESGVSKREAILKKAEKQFDSLIHNPDEKIAFHYLNFNMWLKAKIRGVSMADFICDPQYEASHELRAAFGF